MASVIMSNSYTAPLLRVVLGHYTIYHLLSPVVRPGLCRCTCCRRQPRYRTAGVR